MPMCDWPVLSPLWAAAARAVNLGASPPEFPTVIQMFIHVSVALLCTQSHEAHPLHDTSPAPYRLLQDQPTALRIYLASQKPKWQAAHPSGRMRMLTVHRASASRPASLKAPRRYVSGRKAARNSADKLYRRRSSLRPSSAFSATTNIPSPSPSKRNRASEICSAKCAARRSRRTSTVCGKRGCDWIHKADTR